MNTTDASLIAEYIIATREENISDSQDVDWYVTEEGLNSHLAAEVKAIIIAKMGL